MLVQGEGSKTGEGEVRPRRDPKTETYSAETAGLEAAREHTAKRGAPGTEVRDFAQPLQLGKSESDMESTAASRGKPRLVLMGLRRSGKSSISSVVFNKLAPSETLYLETTTHITKESMRSFMDFQVWDFPAQLDTLSQIDTSSILKSIGAVIWVIDAQDAYFDSITRLVSWILHLQENHPSVIIEVFVHKVDGLSEDFRADCFRDVQQRVLDELADEKCDHAPVSFHQTSIYDHSVFEACSRVVQKLIPAPQLSAMEGLLNSLCSASGMRKAYLFDIQSKIYVASDTSPADPDAYKTCSDYIDLVVDLSDLYGWQRPEAPRDEHGNLLDPSDDMGTGEFNNQTAESTMIMESSGAGYIYLREVHRYLALICIMNEDAPGDRKAQVDYNVGVFQQGLGEVFEETQRAAA